METITLTNWNRKSEINLKENSFWVMNTIWDNVSRVFIYKSYKTLNWAMKYAYKFLLS